MLDEPTQVVFSGSMEYDNLSRKKQTSQERELFDYLSHVAVDPVIARTMEQLHTYETLLNSVEDVERSEIVAIVNSLNETWPYTDEVVQISGTTQNLQKVMRGEPDEQPVIKQDVLSKGFNALQLSKDATSSQSEWTLVFNFSVPSTNMEGFSEQYIARPADVDIEYPFISQEYAQNQLEYEYPQQIEDIDDIIYNADSVESAVMGLRHLDDMLNSPERDLSQTHQLAQLMGHYITSRLQLDKELPYVTKIEGDVVEIDPSTGAYSLSYVPATEFLTTFLSLQLLDQQTVDRNGRDQSRYEFGYGLQAHSNKQGEPSRTLVVPVRNITQSQSIRDLLN